MVVAYNQTRDFMMRAFDLTEDQAITAVTVAVDFEITQVYPPFLPSLEYLAVKLGWEIECQC